MMARRLIVPCCHTRQSRCPKPREQAAPHLGYGHTMWERESLAMSSGRFSGAMFCMRIALRNRAKKRFFSIGVMPLDFSGEAGQSPILRNFTFFLNLAGV